VHYASLASVVFALFGQVSLLPPFACQRRPWGKDKSFLPFLQNVRVTTQGFENGAILRGRALTTQSESNGLNKYHFLGEKSVGEKNVFPSFISLSSTFPL
jgi:hypothetical protein